MGGLSAKTRKPLAWAIVVIAFLAWFLSGVYQVQPDQQGVVLRFGQWVATTPPGLNWHLPYPIETVLTPSVGRIHAIDVGFRASGRDVPEESLMVTADQNLIDIEFTVQWKIADAGEFLFNIRDPEGTVKIVAESAMREIIARTDIQPALTGARRDIELEARELIQEILDAYPAGIEIIGIQLQDVKPPGPVIDGCPAGAAVQ